MQECVEPQPAVGTNIREAEIADSYNRLLQANPEVARASYQALVQIQKDQGLIIHGRPLCNVLRPRFMTEERYVELGRLSTLLASLFERVGRQILGSETLLELIGAADQERILWSIDPGYEQITLTSRLDSFMLGTLPRFVEYNAESPASIGFCDVLSDAFSEMPAMKSLRSHNLRAFQCREALYETLLNAYRSWGGQEPPTVAIVDWQDVLTRRDWELCAEYFQKKGLETVTADPRAFRYSRGRLEVAGKRVTLVYRRVLLHELLEKADEAKDLLRAYEDGAICMVNSPRSKLLHKKAVLALLSEGTELKLSPEEQDLLERTIPWTRLLTDGKTTWNKQQVDLAGHLQSQQERFAIKPNDDYGGRGVILGWDVTADEWEDAIQGAMGGGYVVQERVPVAQANFPVWQDGHVEIMPLFVDTDPLLFDGQMAGILTRISGSPLLNVTAGKGSTAPTFVVEG